MRFFLRLWCLTSLALVAVALPGRAFAAGAAIPPAPARFMTDTVGFVSPGAAAAIDARLEAYQKATGHQVVVWIGDTLSGDDLADWSVRTFAAWKPGRKGVDDGVAMFVLASDKKIDIEVGYGLEGQLTDAKARRIIDNMSDLVRAGDRDGALASGVESIFAAIDGQPFPGATSAQPFANDPRDPRQRPPLGLAQKIFFGIVALGFLILFITNPRMAMLLLWSIMGRGGGGGFGGGGGGGFEGGGGRSGGGGARGGW